MLVYRTVSSAELLNLVNGTEIKNYNVIHGENTFKYEKDKSYIHFFKYEGHALYYMKKRNNPIILRLDIPEELLGNAEYGFYSNVDTYYDDYLYSYYMPLPEYIITTDKFNKDYIVDFSYNGVWQNPKRYNINRDLFWVKKEHLFHDDEVQNWSIESVYYEYIKTLANKLDYDMYKIARYLKDVDLDNELVKMKSKIKHEKIITKRRFSRR